jgi:hypothetical protein
MPFTRIYYTADIHGSEVCFRKFLNVAKRNLYKANVLLLSGDLTGKAIVPIIEGETPGSYVAHTLRLLGDDRVARNQEELEALKKSLETIGTYWIMVNKSEYEDLQADPIALKKLFAEQMLGRLEKWVESAGEMRSLGVKCFIMPGNDDPPESVGIISKSDFVVNPEGECLMIDNHHEMISMGFSNPTPWKTPREVSEDELRNKIDTMSTKVKDMKSCVFNFHCPPYDSHLDTAPILDADMRPTTSGGSVMSGPVGSKAIREAIEKYQPMLGLHGHIHECAGESKIGRTVCANPGSEYQSGILRAYLVNIDEKGVKSLLRVEG